MELFASESGNPACWTEELALTIPRLVASRVSCATCSSVWESRGIVRTASANIASWRRFASALDLTPFTMMAKVKC